MTAGPVRDVRRVLVGDKYTAEDSPGGFYLAEASEPGYFVRLAFGVVFLSDAQLAEARTAADVERGVVQTTEE